MPELPEAESIARELHRRVAGRRIAAIVHVRADIVRTGPDLVPALAGRQVRSVGRRAKRVLLELEPAARVVFQLGMSGRITVEPREVTPAPHTHLRLSFQNWDHELRFRDPRRFGGVWVFHGGDGSANHRPATPNMRRRSPRDTPMRALGPVGLEPLEMTLRQFEGAMDRNRQIKALLMDQSAIAGLGNIYCDESLHAAGIHPLTPARALDAKQRAALFEAIGSTLRRAIRHNGSTLVDYRTPDGKPGGFQRLHCVYQRDDLPCKRCRTPIVRLRVAGRSTFICPHCQPETAGGVARGIPRVTGRRTAASK